MAREARSESDVVAECMMALSAAGCLVWRNNTGQLPDARGRPIKFGLCVGSSDIIGICADGVFLAVECKLNGRTTDAQDRFIAAVIARGGRAGVARCGADAVKIAGKA
jgi:hypothetical protein